MVHALKNYMYGDIDFDMWAYLILWASGVLRSNYQHGLRATPGRQNNQLRVALRGRWYRGWSDVAAIAAGGWRRVRKENAGGRRYSSGVATARAWKHRLLHPSLFLGWRLIGRHYLRTHYDPLLIKVRLRRGVNPGWPRPPIRKLEFLALLGGRQVAWEILVLRASGYIDYLCFRAISIFSLDTAPFLCSSVNHGSERDVYRNYVVAD